jgi:hypothetical protein
MMAKGFPLTRTSQAAKRTVRTIELQGVPLLYRQVRFIDQLSFDENKKGFKTGLAEVAYGAAGVELFSVLTTRTLRKQLPLRSIPAGLPVRLCSTRRLKGG